MEVGQAASHLIPHLLDFHYAATHRWPTSGFRKGETNVVHKDFVAKFNSTVEKILRNNGKGEWWDTGDWQLRVNKFFGRQKQQKRGGATHVSLSTY